MKCPGCNVTQIVECTAVLADGDPGLSVGRYRYRSICPECWTESNWNSNSEPYEIETVLHRNEELDLAFICGIVCGSKGIIQHVPTDEKFASKLRRLGYMDQDNHPTPEGIELVVRLKHG